MVEPAIAGEIADGVNWLWRSDDTGDAPRGEKEPFRGTAMADVAAGEPTKLTRLALLKAGELAGETDDKLGGLPPAFK